MSNPAFSTEQISVCGFGAEQETVNSSNAKAWLSLTPGGADGVPESIDGLECARVLVSPENLSDALADEVIAKVGELPRPLVISCASGARASTVAWLYIASKNKLTGDQVVEQANGAPWLSKPPLVNWVKSKAG